MPHVLLQRSAPPKSKKTQPTGAKGTVPPFNGPPVSMPNDNWRALYRQFEDVATSDEKRREIAGELVDLMPNGEVDRMGPALAHHMMMVNATGPAIRLLERVAASLDLDLTMEAFPVRAPQAKDLIRAASSAAQNGNHEVAFGFLRVAFVYAQMLLIGATRHRKFILEENNQAVEAYNANVKDQMGHGIGPTKIPPRDPTPLPPEDTSTAAIDLMRNIFALYPDFAFHERTKPSPDLEQANVYDAQALRLSHDLRSNMLSVAGEYQLIVAQFEKATDSRGQPGYRIGEGPSEIMTGLPNLGKIEEANEYNVLNRMLSEVVGDVIDQQQLISDIFRFPSVLAEFGHLLRWPDIRDLDIRVKVWQTLWPDLVAGVGLSSSPEPLSGLIDLIERFHKAFSVHPIFNIRDFGDNYLTSGMPQDLTGRTVSDCGVFALTIAYELLEVTRKSGLDVDFDMYTSTDHVMLAIEDRDNKQFYVVSNNDIGGPFPDSMPRMKEIGRVYAQTFDHDEAFIAAMKLPLPGSKASKKQKTKSIKADLWDRYQTANAWQFKQEANRPEPTQEYYHDLGQFDSLHRLILNELAPIALELQKPKPSIQMSQLDQAVLWGITMAELYLVNQIRWREATSTTARADQRSLKMQEFFVGSTAEGEPNSLVELRKALLAAKNAGVDLSSRALDFLDLEGRVGKDISPDAARAAAIERGSL